MSVRIEEFNDANWEERVLGASKPVLVDFWAEWCAPCRMMEPVIEALAEEYDGRAIVGKLNIDDNAIVANRYQILGIPAILVIKDGEVKEQVVGVTTQENLETLLKKHVDSKSGGAG